MEDIFHRINILDDIYECYDYDSDIVASLKETLTEDVHQVVKDFICLRDEINYLNRQINKLQVTRDLISESETNLFNKLVDARVALRDKFVF